ncbi:MAG: hypothetical protein EZS28_019003, partial [Streblomastix strix]
MGQNKGRYLYTRNISQDPNVVNVMITNKHENGRKNNSLSRDIETSKGSGIHTEGGFLAIQKQGLRNGIVTETEEFSVFRSHGRGNSIDGEIGMNGTDQVRDLIRKGDWATSLDLKSAFHHLIVYPSHRQHLAFEAMGEVQQNEARLFGTQHSPIFIVQALAMVLTKIRRESDIRILNYVDDLLLLHQNKERLRKQTLIIMKIFETFGQTIAQEKKDIHKDDGPKKIGTTLLIKEIYQPNIEISSDQDQIPSINNRQTEFSKSSRKRSFLPLKINGLSKNESFDEQRQEREYETIKRNPLRALLVARNDSEQLRDDFRSENSNGSKVQDATPKGWKVTQELQTGDFFSTTWRVEQGTEALDKQLEGDGSHILKSILPCINLQSAADQSDPHQFRQVYRNIRFNKTESRTNTSSRSEENSQAMSTTENTNIDSIYSRSIKQDNRHIKQIKPPKRIFSKERNIQSSIPDVIDYPNIGLVRDRGQQLVDRFVAIGEEEEGAEWLNAFSRSWKEEIFWIHPPIPKIGKVLIAW